MPRGKPKALSIYDAAAQGHALRVSECLTRERWDPNAVNADGVAPLHLAVTAGHIRVVKVLLKAQADINVKTPPQGLTALHIAACLKSEQAELIQTLIAAGADLAALDGDGNPPLHQAIHAGRTSSVIELVRGGGSALNVRDEQGRSGLVCAICSSQVDMVRALVKAGAECARSNANGATVIHLAAGVGHPLIIKELLKTLKADVNKQTQDGSTPLHFAAGAVKVLLKHKAYTEARDHMGQTALILACSVAMPQLDMVRALISAGADVSARMNNMYSALHLASAKNEADIMSALIGAGADPTGRNDWGVGLSPLHLAAQNGSLSATKVLLAEGASPAVPDSVFCTPFHHAASGGHGDLLEAMVGTLELPQKTDNSSRSSYNPPISTKTDTSLLVHGMPPQGGRLTSKKPCRVQEERPMEASLQSCAARKIVCRAELRFPGDEASTDSAVSVPWTSPPPLRLENKSSDPGSVDIAPIAPCLGGEVTREDGIDESQLHRGDLVIRPSSVPSTYKLAAALNAKDIDGMTALHVSVGYSNAESTRVLLCAGASEKAVTISGKLVYDLMGAYVSFEDRAALRDNCIRRMLIQAPALRTRSWLWPTAEKMPKNVLLELRPSARPNQAASERLPTDSASETVRGKRTPGDETPIRSEPQRQLASREGRGRWKFSVQWFRPKATPNTQNSCRSVCAAICGCYRLDT